MHENTHPLVAVQRTVRAIREVAATVARSEIATSKRLGTITTIAPSNATLSAALTSGTAYTSLSVTALGTAINSGANVVLTSGSNTQTFVASAAAAIGATSISVNSLAANYAYPTGALVDPCGLTVTLDGAQTAVPAFHLNSYSPVINDRVACEVFARQLLVLGTFS